MKRFVLTLLLILASVWAEAGTVDYPRVSPDGRHLVNRDGYPLFLHADSPWSLMVALTREETTNYFATRQQQGFNALITQLVENRYAGVDNPFGSPTNRYGQPPFLVPNDFSTPNEAYFTNADWVVQSARDHGMVLLLNPCYVGYPNSNEGWYNAVIANGVDKCRAYGRWVGDRYRNTPNLIWVMYGDRNVDAAAPMINAMAEGIREADTNHLITAHMVRRNSSRDQLEGRSWLSLNSVYTDTNVVPAALAAHAKSPVMPAFHFEAYYEGEHAMTPLQLRSQSYAALLSGACGDAFGNRPVWLFDSGWLAALNSTGATAMTHVASLFLSRPWFRLVPDTGHAFVISGYGIPGTPGFVPAAVASDGSTAMAYLPVGHAISVNLTVIAGTNATLWWFNPRNGIASQIGNRPTSSTESVTPPDSNDWVLVVDAVNAGLPPPGSQKYQLPPTVDVGPDRYLPWPRNQASFSPKLSFHHAPDDPEEVALAWTVKIAPDSVSFSPTNTVADITATFVAPGAYRLALHANDAGVTAESEVNVTVRPNAGPSAPVQLLCEGDVSPTAVATRTPFLSWSFLDPDAGDYQSACQVELMDGTSQPVWDSGKVSTTNTGLLYAGPPLLPGRSYVWRVMTWDNFDEPGDFSPQAAFLLTRSSGELLTNGGFESGDATGWMNSGGGQLKSGSIPPGGDMGPKAGLFQAYWDNSSELYSAYQDVALGTYAGAIDTGTARLNATGWLVSNDHQADPPFDQFNLQVRFFNGAGLELSPARYDTGVLNVPDWGRYGLTNFAIPPSTRTIRVQFGCWEAGYDAGSADEFSVELLLPATLAILTQTLPVGVTGKSYSLQFEVEGGLAPFIWTLAEGSDPLPSGLALSSTGSLAGVPATTGTYNLSVRVSDSQGHSAYRTLPLAVTIPPLSATTTSLVHAIRGQPYSVALQATGGVPPYAWTLAATSAALPDGLLLQPDGVLEGTTLTAGSFPFTSQVFDNLGATAVQGLTLQVNPAEIRLGTFPQTQAQIMNQGFQFWLYSDASGSFAIDRSQNLRDWTELFSIGYAGGQLPLLDTNVTTSNRWFYRGRFQ